MTTNAQGFQIYYPATVVATGLPVYSQQSQTTAAIPSRDEPFDSFVGYVRPQETNTVANQTLPRGAINGVPKSTHNPGDPNL